VKDISAQLCCHVCMDLYAVVVTSLSLPTFGVGRPLHLLSTEAISVWPDVHKKSVTHLLSVQTRV